MYQGRRIDFSNTNIVLDSNSLGNWNAPTTWMVNLSALIANANTTYQNFSVSGQTTTNMVSDAATQIDGAFVEGKTNVLFVMEVGNDLYYGATLAAAQETYKTYCMDRRKRGFKVISMTCFDRDGYNQPLTMNADLKSFNNWLRVNWPSMSNSIVDVYDEPRFRLFSNFGDGVHQSPNDNPVIARLAYEVLKKLVI
jgi:lysophospholipase L1-like esterase